MFSIRDDARQGSTARAVRKSTWRGAVRGRAWGVSMLLGLGLAVAAGGCANIHDNQPAALSTAPLQIDQAMQTRIWNRTVASYQNGSVVAGRTLYPYRPADDLPYWAYPPVEAGLFYGQTLAMPVTAFLEPDPAVYSGAIVPPTYNAVPPIQTVR